MKITNKLEKSFGSVGTLAGVLVFIAGIFALYYSLIGLILIFIGAFVGFTSTSTSIDTDKKRVRFSNNLFGILKTGKWIAIKPDMKIGLNISNKIWTAYSQGNRSLDIDIKAIQILLFDANNNKIIPLKKLKSPDSAKIEIEKLRLQLGLTSANSI